MFWVFKQFISFLSSTHFFPKSFICLINVLSMFNFRENPRVTSHPNSFTVSQLLVSINQLLVLLVLRWRRFWNCVQIFSTRRSVWRACSRTMSTSTEWAPPTNTGSGNQAKYRTQCLRLSKDQSTKMVGRPHDPQMIHTRYSHDPVHESATSGVGLDHYPDVRSSSKPIVLK